MSKENPLSQLIKTSADPKTEPQVKAVADLAINAIKTLETAHAVALEDAAGQIVDLQEKVEALSTGKVFKPSFTLKGKGDFEVQHGVNLEGVLYSATEIAENAAVQKKLVEGGSSAVTKKVTE